MHKTLPTYSVVIPCYNAEPFLRETLESVLAQTLSPLEVIVVDDGSTDDSAAIAKSYGQPIRVIRQENQGESVARNRGMDVARGDWIAFLDADDVWKPEKLESQISAVKPGAICILTGIYTFGGIRKVLLEQDHEVAIQISSRMDLLRMTGFCKQPPQFVGPCSTMMVRRTVPVRFPQWTQWGEDLIYQFDILDQGEMWYVPQPLAGLRQHSKKQTSNVLAPLFHCRSVAEWLERRKGSIPRKERASIQRVWETRLAKYAATELSQRRFSNCLRFAMGLGFNPRYWRLLFPRLLVASLLPIWDAYHAFRIWMGRWRRIIGRRVLEAFRRP